MKRFIHTLLVGILLATNAQAQTPASKPPANWFNLDPEQDKIFGIATERAYSEVLKDKPSRTIIVAVLDGGVDYEHEDLKGRMWRNPKEVAGNGVDDDKNGYVDDVYGWNFLGGKDGRNVNQDNLELTREYVKLHARYKDLAPGNVKNQKEYQYYLEVKRVFEKKRDNARKLHTQYKQLLQQYERAYATVKKALRADTLTLELIRAYQPGDQQTQMQKQFLLMAHENNISRAQLKSGVESLRSQVEYQYNDSFDPRGIVGDNYANPKERYYGNPDVRGPNAKHGTHVAGIIAAERGNNLGVRGVADNVRIMALRTVPDGDERDKDVANAIRYAVDNGAHIINMSFGKGYSPYKQVVDEAFAYAEKKGVLIVHASGNEGYNLDNNKPHFPVRHLNNKKSIGNWIEVAANGWDEAHLAASFSNYGKKEVDVFAPGMAVHSTVPGSKYEDMQGTSMAAPVVSGVAAVLMSYFPKLKPADVKKIILASVVKYSNEVEAPADEDAEEEAKNKSRIPFDQLSSTGGVVNLYKAVQLAETYK